MVNNSTSTIDYTEDKTRILFNIAFTASIKHQQSN